MATMTLELPEAVLVGSGQSREDFLNEARFILMARLFEQGRISSGKASEICAMNRIDFLLAVGRLGIPVIQLDTEELRHDLAQP